MSKEFWKQFDKAKKERREARMDKNMRAFSLSLLPSSSFRFVEPEKCIRFELTFGVAKFYPTLDKWICNGVHYKGDYIKFLEWCKLKLDNEELM